LEDVNLAGARGVLVNITANTTLKMKEVNDVMATVRAFTAEDATVIVGTVIDEEMTDNLRVTVVATGLGAAVNRSQPKPLTVVKTGTDTSSMEVVDYEQLEAPAVMRRRSRETTVEAMRQSGVELLDIPAFLRKQAD
jgi:cell division protein FtsZ